MEGEETRTHCQIACLPLFFEGYAEIPPESLVRRVRVALRRSVNPRHIRALKSQTDQIINRLTKLFVRTKEVSCPETSVQASGLKPGDLVRVRSEAEIRASLDHFGRLKGCMFMPEMLPYCGTVQRVFRPMTRFVDERDYHVKKCRGIVLLDGLQCQGTSHYGRCDRACYYFWREEWLEEADQEAFKGSDSA